MLKIDTSDLTIKIKQFTSLRIGNLKDYQKPILTSIQAKVSDNFSKQKDGDGREWKKLLPATIKQKKRQGFGDTPLVRLGNLRQAVNSLTILESDEKSLTIGIADDEIRKIAKFQQLGTKHIPSRPFLVVNTRLSETVVRTVVEGEIKKIEKALKK